jgi:hypothetical protein
MMDRTDRILLILVTLVHIVAQAYLYHSLAVDAPALLHPSRQKINQIARSLGVDPKAYRESFRYTATLYPFLPPDTVWLKKSR